MSYNEYLDLFYKAQNDGNYHMFIFDIKNSKSYDLEIAHIESVSLKIIKSVYSRLEELEITSKKRILHKFNSNDVMLNQFVYSEPFQFGDMFGFTIIRDSISNIEVYKIFYEEKEKLNIYWDFHIIDGFYETDDYGEGKERYYRGYCMPQLEELSKKKKIK